MEEEEEGAGTAMLRCGSQQAPESMSVVERDLWRGGSAACLERKRNGIVRTDKFVDRQRESSEGIENAGVGEDKEGVRTAGPRRGSKRMPQGKRMVRKISGKRAERRAEQLDGGAEMEASGADLSYVPRMAVAEKLNSVKVKLKKMNEDQYSLMVSLQLAQKELKRVKGESKKKDVLIESLREAAKAKKPGGRGQERGPGESNEPPTVRDLCARMGLCLFAGSVRSGIGLCKVEDIRVVF